MLKIENWYWVLSGPLALSTNQYQYGVSSGFWNATKPWNPEMVAKFLRPGGHWNLGMRVKFANTCGCEFTCHPLKIKHEQFSSQKKGPNLQKGNESWIIWTKHWENKRKYEFSGKYQFFRASLGRTPLAKKPATIWCGKEISLRVFWCPAVSFQGGMIHTPFCRLMTHDSYHSYHSYSYSYH